MDSRRLVLRLVTAIAALCATAAWSAPERAWYLSPDQVSLTAGSGNDVSVTGLKIRTKDWRTFSLGGGWNGHVGLEGGFMYWKGDGTGSGPNSIADVGLTPVFRFAYTGFPSFTPYVEGGIGAHLISNVRIGTRTLSTAYQFGEHLGVGVMFGARKEYALSAFIQHVSNGSIKRPNNGLTYVGLNVSYQFK